MKRWNDHTLLDLWNYWIDKRWKWNTNTTIMPGNTMVDRKSWIQDQELLTAPFCPWFLPFMDFLSCISSALLHCLLCPGRCKHGANYTWWYWFYNQASQSQSCLSEGKILDKKITSEGVETKTNSLNHCSVSVPTVSVVHNDKLWLEIRAPVIRLPRTGSGLCWKVRSMDEVELLMLQFDGSHWSLCTR